MSLILPPSKEEREKELRIHWAYRKAYEENPELRKLADRIHESRLMAGPACNQCVETAMLKLNLKLPE